MPNPTASFSSSTGRGALARPSFLISVAGSSLSRARQESGSVPRSAAAFPVDGAGLSGLVSIGGALAMRREERCSTSCGRFTRAVLAAPIIAVSASWSSSSSSSSLELTSKKDWDLDGGPSAKASLSSCCLLFSLVSRCCSSTTWRQ